MSGGERQPETMKSNNEETKKTKKEKTFALLVSSWLLVQGGAMKRLKIQLVILIVALAGLSAGYGLSRAAGQVAGDNVVVNQVKHEDLLIAGRNLQVQSEVKGDVTAAGSDVTIAGPVAGYVMVAGARVNINGPVGNDLWAAGSNVNPQRPGWRTTRCWLAVM